MKNRMRVFIDTGECVGKYCGFCIPVCPNNAIYVDLTAHIDGTICTGCLNCTKNICPNCAIIARDCGDQS